jgi:NADPH2:quinone reductase
MKTCWFDQFGPARTVLQIGDRQTPEPGQGEVLVRLHTTGVNPSDVKKRAGAFPDLLDIGPVVPHSDGAGVITAVGAGVQASRIGERVFVYQAQHGRLHGTAAEYVAIDSLRAPRLPDSANFDVGACLGIPVRHRSADLGDRGCRSRRPLCDPMGAPRGRTCDSHGEQ